MSETKETLVALGVGVAIAAIVACGGSNKSSNMAVGAPGSVPTNPPMGESDPRARITALDSEITTEFAKLQAGPRPDATNLCPVPPCAAMATAVKPTNDPTCTHGDGQTCKDMCQIADAICDAATKICGIAKELNDDPWAIEKCSSGNASCEKSRGKCCGCS